MGGGVDCLHPTRERITYVHSSSNWIESSHKLGVKITCFKRPLIVFIIRHRQEVRTYEGIIKKQWYLTGSFCLNSGWSSRFHFHQPGTEFHHIIVSLFETKMQYWSHIWTHRNSLLQLNQCELYQWSKNAWWVAIPELDYKHIWMLSKYVYLEPIWPVFVGGWPPILRVTSSKNMGHLGSIGIVCILQ